MTSLAMIKPVPSGVFLCLVLVHVLCAAAAPARPSVQFDVDAVVSCRDVTPAEFAAMNSGEKLIEATLRVSTFMPPGENEASLEHLYVMESVCGAMLAADYLPKTTLASGLAGNLLVERKEERTKTLGLNLKSTCETVVAVAGTAGTDAKSGAIIKYEELAPLELISACGPIRRGAGVYFKLKATARHSLQGVQPFVVIFRVPQVWRGSYLHVRCEAWRTCKGLPTSLKEPEAVGLGDFFVALHLDGDAGAKQAAVQFAQADSQLRTIAAQCDSEVPRQAPANVPYPVGKLISLVKPKTPNPWLPELLYSSPYADPGETLNRIPLEARSSAELFVALRQRLIQCGDAQPSENAVAVKDEPAP